MLYIERWKTNLIILVCVLGILYALPNVLGKDTVSWLQKNLPAALPTKTVNLGLDLRGGSHLLLQVSLDAVIEEKMQALVDQVRSAFREANIGYTDLRYTDGAVQFKLTKPEQESAARDALDEVDRDLDVSVENGMSFVRMSEAQIREKKQLAMEQSIEIVRRRVDETGTSEPSIQKQGEDRILVQLPGVDDPGRIKKLLGQTAKLTFRLVDVATSNDPLMRAPVGSERLPSAEEKGRSWVVQKRVMVAGDSLIDARPSYGQNGEPVVSFRFDSQGAKRFGDATRTNMGRPFAIVLDNKVISAPVIREPITGGSGQISGSFTTETARDLALLLRAGALPAPIQVLEERTIGPGLGADSIKAGAYACLIGALLVMVGVQLAYGLFGIFANIALFFNIALIFAALSFLQATLTLPGIAGIVLTIGMAVDANVLIFERIREESRLGRSVIPAIDSGYQHALSSIIDANVTTLIAAFLLYMFGSGPIKGFAVTLSIGIITSIFSALMISRQLVVWWVQIKKPKVIPI